MKIPDMTDPKGRYWNQPDRSEIVFHGARAYMTYDTFKKLAEYSGTIPTGTYSGKMWKRCIGNAGTLEDKVQQTGWAYELVWYGAEDGDNIAIERCVLRVVPPENMPKAVPEMSDEEACDILFGIDDAEIDRRWIQQFCNAILRAHDRQQLFISWPECSINSEFSERGTDFHFQVQIWGVNSRVRMRPDPRRRHHGRFTV